MGTGPVRLMSALTGCSRTTTVATTSRVTGKAVATSVETSVTGDSRPAVLLGPDEYLGATAVDAVHDETRAVALHIFQRQIAVVEIKIDVPSTEAHTLTPRAPPILRHHPHEPERHVDVDQTALPVVVDQHLNRLQVSVPFGGFRRVMDDHLVVVARGLSELDERLRSEERRVGKECRSR